jgi:hypothetical protein
MSLRTQYLASNPDGKFNEQIVKGEVTKGMNLIEVLASWGLPTVRRTRPMCDGQHWTYYSIDEVTGGATSYDLIFEHRLLMRWVIENDVDMAADLPPRHLSGLAPEVQRERPDKTFTGDSGTVKKD